MRKVTVDRGESGPRWPLPCIAEDRNGFTVFHLPGFAVPKIALVSSLLSPKVRLRSTFFSHLQPSTRCSLSAGVPPHHTQRRNAPQMLLVDSTSLNTRTFSPRHPPCEPFLLSRSNLFAAKLPVAGHLISSRPPLGHRRGRCHENQKFPGPVSIPALVAGQPAITGRVPR